MYEVHLLFPVIFSSLFEVCSQIPRGPVNLLWGRLQSVTVSISSFCLYRCLSSLYEPGTAPGTHVHSSRSAPGVCPVPSASPAQSTVGWLPLPRGMNYTILPLTRSLHPGGLFLRVVHLSVLSSVHWPL